MSVSLTQTISKSFRGIKRWLLGFFMTDEIFAVASQEKDASAKLFLGLSCAPWFGWTFGTLFGSLIGNVLPPIVMNSLCIAIYGMFLAIVIPPAKKSKPIILVICIAVFISCILHYVPYLNKIPTGIGISISAVIASLIGAFMFPIENKGENVNE